MDDLKVTCKSNQHAPAQLFQEHQKVISIDYSIQSRNKKFFRPFVDALSGHPQECDFPNLFEFMYPKKKKRRKKKENFQSLINAWICLFSLVSVSFHCQNLIILEVTAAGSSLICLSSPTNILRLHVFSLVFSSCLCLRFFAPFPRHLPVHDNSGRLEGAAAPVRDFPKATFPFSFTSWLAVKTWKCFSEKLSEIKKKINLKWSQSD